MIMINNQAIEKDDNLNHYVDLLLIVVKEVKVNNLIWVKYD